MSGSLPNRRIVFRALAFAWVLVPITVFLAVIFAGLGAGGGMTRVIEAAAAYSVGFLVLATLGFVVASSLLPPVRSPWLATRPRAFPSVAALVFLAFTLGGLVEGSTDAVGRSLGTQSGWMVATLVFLWAVVATILVVGVDRAVVRFRRAEPPEPASTSPTSAS